MQLIETSFLNKMLRDEKMALVIEYIRDVSKIYKFNDDLFDEFLKIYSLTKGLNNLIPLRNHIKSKRGDKCLVLNGQDKTGLLTLMISLFCDYDRIFSHVPFKSITKCLTTFSKQFDIDNMIYLTEIHEEYLVKWINEFNYLTIHQVNIFGDKYYSGLEQTEFFISLNNPVTVNEEIYNVEFTNVIKSFNNNINYKKHLDYIPF